jgi:hypothetical protein
MLRVERFHREVERGAIFNLVDHRLAQSFFSLVRVCEMVRLLLESVVGANEEVSSRDEYRCDQRLPKASDRLR